MGDSVSGNTARSGVGGKTVALDGAGKPRSAGAEDLGAKGAGTGLGCRAVASG